MGKMTKNNNGNNCLEIWKVSKMIKTTYNKNSRRMIKKQKSMKSISPNLWNTWEYINRFKCSGSPPNEIIESNIFNPISFFNFKVKGKSLHLCMFETKSRFTSNFASVLLNMTKQLSIIFKVFGENVFTQSEYQMVKNLPAMREICVPRLGRSLGGRRGNPLQYSCLKNPMDTGTRQATVHGLTKSWTRLKWLSTRQHRVLVCEGNRICLQYIQGMWNTFLFTIIT